jgi:Peptidase A4 family
MPLSPRRVVAAALAVAAVLAADAGAGAQAQAAKLHATSSNWAGYAARRTGVQFQRVSGAWTVPAVDCSDPTRTFSANWVGLGGYAPTSRALEQLGTESDCATPGQATYQAWFEVVPAAATKAEVTVRPGDQVFASATVHGTLVTLTLANRTRGTKATKSIRAATVDRTSAEWIVEAPSVCFGSTTSSCRQTPLANFATTGFSAARATTTGGHAGSILDPNWNAIAIMLSPESSTGRGPDGDAAPPGGPRGDETQARASSASATPSVLSPDGAAFSVGYAAGG